MSDDIKRGRKPTHPGTEFLEVAVKPMIDGAKLSYSTAIEIIAKDMNCNAQLLGEVLAEERPVTPKMAQKMGNYTKTSVNSWYGMQVKLDTWELLDMAIDGD